MCVRVYESENTRSIIAAAAAMSWSRGRQQGIPFVLLFYQTRSFWETGGHIYGVGQSTIFLSQLKQ